MNGLRLLTSEYGSFTLPEKSSYHYMLLGCTAAPRVQPNWECKHWRLLIVIEKRNSWLAWIKLVFLIILGVLGGLNALYKACTCISHIEIERDSRDWRVKHKFEANWRKKNGTLCNTEGEKKRWFFFCSRHTRNINLVFFLGRLFGCYNYKELYLLPGVEDLATEFCGEVVFVPRGIIVFSQFIVNSSFGYNLTVVISILL